MIKKSDVVFANEKLEKLFKNLKETDPLKKFIIRAIKDIQENAFCGIRLPKRLNPPEYVKKYKINNVWKYNLPNGWRLLYSVTTPSSVEILSVILEWSDHKNYERRFKY